VDTTGKTYLFGGDQFVRYTDATAQYADEGYPLAISTRWTNLPDSFKSDIDAVLSFKSPVDNVQRLYLFKADSYVRFSTGDLTQVDARYRSLKLAAQTEGSWFRGSPFTSPTTTPTTTRISSRWSDLRRHGRRATADLRLLPPHGRRAVETHLQQWKLADAGPHGQPH
jgi:hypothetical protein